MSLVRLWRCNYIRYVKCIKIIENCLQMEKMRVLRRRTTVKLRVRLRVRAAVEYCPTARVCRATVAAFWYYIEVLVLIKPSATRELRRTTVSHYHLTKVLGRLRKSFVTLFSGIPDWRFDMCIKRGVFRCIFVYIGETFYPDETRFEVSI